MPERIYKLQPDRTLSLRGFNTFAAAACIHNATPTGFEVSGTFRDPADFAVAVLYDADNFFEHPSIKYLPDFNFAGLTLDFSLLYTDSLQPMDSPKYNWIDWATLDVIRADGSTAKISLWENAMLADVAFPAASATLNVTSPSAPQFKDEISLWYENLAFAFMVPGGMGGSATYFWQDAGTTASISVGSNAYTYNVTGQGGESGEIIAAGVAAAAATDSRVAFAADGNTVNFVSRVNTGGTVSVSGYQLWLVTNAASYIASNIADQINSFNWIGANSSFGLLASRSGAGITLEAARYGTVATSGAAVSWVSGTKFSGLTAGSTIRIAGTEYSIASVHSPIQLTLSSAAPSSASAAYLAPRGGRDGNMLQVYTLATDSANLAFDRSQIRFSGGSSMVTWNCSFDFTALGIDSIRQCWLTFAPSLANGAAYTAAEWQADFSNWQLHGPESTKALQVAGPGSVRIEENDSACMFTENWAVESGFYSKYYAKAASLVNDSVTVSYTCQFTHNLYLGTSLYHDRGVAGIRLDGDTETLLDCRVNDASAVVTRRLLRSSVPAGSHTVVIRVEQAGAIYFDYLEAAVLSDVPDALTPRTKVSPALDFDTDHTYKLPPARLMWIMDQLGYAGPMNEYLGVFWWNERTASGGSFSTAQVTFGGTFAAGDSVILNFNPPDGTQIGKSIFAADTPGTIANHFAAYINGALINSWATATDSGVLTLTARSPAKAYNLALTATVSSAAGTVMIAPNSPAVGEYPVWVVNDSANPPINRAVRDWHADFYAQCAARGRQVVTACSMELVHPPDGYVARFPNQTAVATQTGFGDLNSNHCAAGSAKLLAYQKAVYRNIAAMQLNAGLTPSVQYGEFLWWYSVDPAGSGMGYYDAETAEAAQAALGRPLHTFLTTNDDPTVNSSADAIFLRNRLRDHVGALVADIRAAFPTVRCEVLWPYDVNYPTPVPAGTPETGGRLNHFVNLPVEWQAQSTSGLDTMKLEALAFTTSLRNLDLAREAIGLFTGPGFVWQPSALRYLLPIFGFASPWERELALVWAAGLPLAEFWAFDHICLFNLDVPERQLARRSFIKNR
ncbi:MAG: hypothetical protein M3N93_13650 [Acidobacteriota bacterium]|nr:hypothetical protein [Acidobacteriota bacterium]